MRVRLVLAVLILLLPGIVSGAESTGPLHVSEGETLTILPGDILHHTGSITVSGNGQVLVHGTLDLDGHLVITQDGIVKVDGGTLNLGGDDTHITLTGNAGLAVINGAVLHFVQSYVHQHTINAHDTSRVFFFQAEVRSDGSAETVILRDSAAYTAIATTFDDWTTWYMWNTSALTLDTVNKAGDIVFYDSPSINVKNTVGVMPWMYFPEGAVADLSLPDTADCRPTSLSIDPSVVTGIGWSLSIEDSYCVALGISSYPGSDVTIRDTSLSMAMVRLTGDRFYFVPGEFKNGEHHDDRVFSSLPDRKLRLVNSSVDWWKVDAHESADVIANDIVFSEMMVIDDARMWITDSICEGQTIHLGALDDAVVYFKGGEVWSYVSTWGNATMILDDALVDHTKAEYLYQYTNIAHQKSRLYAVNSDFVSPADDPGGALPRAVDAALVMFARLAGLPDAPAKGWIPIRGEAWVESGPSNFATFARYTLSVRPKGGRLWRQIRQGILPAREQRILGWWNPSLMGFKAGKYEIALTVEVAGDDPATERPTHDFPAIREIVLN
jgi:hypothetical protein